jgi:hypothetical protein
MSNVIDLDSHRKTEPQLLRSEKLMNVFGLDYVVRTSMWSETSKGFFTVTRLGGEMLFVRPAGIPDKQIADLIAAWVDGHGRGRAQALVTPRAVSDGGDLV